MPIYEYHCSSCGRDFARLQKVGAGIDGIRCPDCASDHVERRVSTFASSQGGATTTRAPSGCGPAST